MKNSEQSAFPSLVHDGGHQYDVGGLTKREYFAAMALQGILSNAQNNSYDLMGVNGNGSSNFGFIAAEFAAKEAVHYADQLLKQLEQ